MADDPIPAPALTPGHPLLRADRRIMTTRAALRALGRVAPGTTARIAEALFVKTARPTPRPDEAAWLATAERFSVRAAGQTIAGYAWGSDGPTVVVAHGWWSHAGRFAPLAKALLAAGMRVVAYDAPGHGRSTGWRATMPEFAATIRAVADHHGPLHAVVGHSLGGAASIFALARGLTASRAVIIAAPADITSWAVRFRDTFDISDRIYAQMQRNMERRLQISWHDLDIPILARQLTQPALIIHDEQDPDVPYAEGKLLAEAWHGSILHTTQQLGHRAILRDRAVIETVVDFLGGRGTP
ncbi:MAG: alpha/beta fold hydrolase [Gemmatimonadales bacterium]